MPTLHTYIVRQEQELKLVATSPEEAVRQGAIAFNDKPDATRDIRHNLRQEIRTTEISAREDF